MSKIEEILKKFNETEVTFTDRYNWICEDGQDLKEAIDKCILKFQANAKYWDNEKQQNFCERIQEIMQQAEVNLGNVTKRIKTLKNESVKSILTDEDKKNAEKVTLKNLRKCYNDPNRNLYIDNEIVDGFSMEEVACAIKEWGKDCYCL